MFVKQENQTNSMKTKRVKKKVVRNILNKNQKDMKVFIFLERKEEKVVAVNLMLYALDVYRFICNVHRIQAYR